MDQEKLLQYILDELKANNVILRDNGLKLETITLTTTEHTNKIAAIEEKLRWPRIRFGKYFAPIFLGILLIFLVGRISVTGFDSNPEIAKHDTTAKSSTLIILRQRCMEMTFV